MNPAQKPACVDPGSAGGAPRAEAFRIWKIGSPTRHLGQWWWPVFERFAGERQDDPPVAFCVESAGRFKAQNAHDLIDWLRKNP